MPATSETNRGQDTIAPKESLQKSITPNWQELLQTFSNEEYLNNCKDLWNKATNGELPRGFDITEMDRNFWKEINISFHPTQSELTQAPIGLQMLFHDLGIKPSDSINVETSIFQSKEDESLMQGNLEVKPEEISKDKIGIRISNSGSDMSFETFSTMKQGQVRHVDVFGNGDRWVSTSVPSHLGETINNFYGRPDVTTINGVSLLQGMEWINQIGDKKRDPIITELGWLDLDNSSHKDLEEAILRVDATIKFLEEGKFNRHGIDIYDLEQGAKSVRVDVTKDARRTLPNILANVLLDLGIEDENINFELSSTWSGFVLGINPENITEDRYGIWIASNGDIKLNKPRSMVFYNRGGFQEVDRSQRSTHLKKMPAFFRKQIVADSTNWLVDFIEANSQ